MKREAAKYPLYTRARWHLFWVYHDPDFIKAVNKLPIPPANDDSFITWRKRCYPIADKFHISWNDVYRFKRIGVEALKRPAIGSVAQYDPSIDSIVLWMDTNVTEADFRKMWAKVNRVKKERLELKATKRKPPEDTMLIYAIFKARSRGETFREIFDKFQNGKLAGYRGDKLSKPKFRSEDELEKYYQKYKPNRFEDNTTY